MTDRDLLTSLEGQQYVVLRPTRQVAELYDAEQTALSASLSGVTSHPNSAHVTLRGFAEPDRVAELKHTIAEWAGLRRPIELQADAIDGFPHPYQVLIVRLRRHPTLVDAYSSLSDALDSTDFQRIGELPVNQWIFHLSLLYCSGMSSKEWEDAYASSKRAIDSPATDVVSEAELVWYENGIEHSEAIPFAPAN